MMHQMTPVLFRELQEQPVESQFVLMAGRWFPKDMRNGIIEAATLTDLTNVFEPYAPEGMGDQLKAMLMGNDDGPKQWMLR